MHIRTSLSMVKGNESSSFEISFHPCRQCECSNLKFVEITLLGWMRYFCLGHEIYVMIVSLKDTSKV